MQKPPIRGLLYLSDNLVDKFFYIMSVCQRIFVTLPKFVRTINITNMVFTERIKQLREQLNLPQRKVAEALNIDSATYCKIERGERKAKKDQLPILAKYLNADLDELTTLWLAEKMKNVALTENEKIATEAIRIVYKSIR